MHLRSKSVESARHEAVRMIENSLKDKEYTLEIFLNIEGAFNNSKIDSIRGVLEELGLETLVMNWVVKMLESRVIR